MTPSLWPLESRPFLVLPAPFLWADSIVNGNGDFERGDFGGKEREWGPNSPLRKDEEEVEVNEIPLKEAIRLKLIDEVTAIFKMFDEGFWSSNCSCFHGREMIMEENVILSLRFLYG